MNLTQTHPELIKQWDFDKNTILPEDVTAGSHKIVWWKCPVFDDHCWESNIQNRAQKGNTCPCCCNRKTVKSNCLQTTHPELAAQWDVQNSISPTEITAGYNKKAWWRCHKNHIWQSAVNARTIRGDGCPYCSGLKATPENNFAVGRHKILEEWDYDLNLITPEKITPNSGKKSGGNVNKIIAGRLLCITDYHINNNVHIVLARKPTTQHLYLPNIQSYARNGTTTRIQSLRVNCYHPATKKSTGFVKQIAHMHGLQVH